MFRTVRWSLKQPHRAPTQVDPVGYHLNHSFDAALYFQSSQRRIAASHPATTSLPD